MSTAVTTDTFNREAVELFGSAFTIEQISECRVNRLRVSVRGIQTAVARVALGGQRTQVWLTLTDGRRLESLARDNIHQAERLERFLNNVEHEKAKQWANAVLAGKNVNTGKVVISSAGLTRGRKTLSWSHIGGYSMRDGALMIDDSRHRMVFNLWIAETPWVGAIATVIDILAPGKDYARMSPQDLPNVGFFATSALTHVAGAMTMRGRGYLLGGMLLVGALVGLGILVSNWLEERRLQAWWRSQVEKDVADYSNTLTSDAAFAALPACQPIAQWDLSYVITARQHNSALELTMNGRSISELLTFPDHLLIWTSSGDKSRGVYLPERLGANANKPCRVESDQSSVASLIAAIPVTNNPSAVRAPSPYAKPVDMVTPQVIAPNATQSAQPTRTLRNVNSNATTKAASLQMLQQTVKKNNGRLRACYDRALRTTPNLSGRVQVKVVIDGSGEVASVTDYNSKLANREVIDCVVKSFLTMQFPTPLDGQTTSFIYPIDFR